MQPLTFDRTYYLSGENTWEKSRLLAYEDVGRLTISESQIVFESANRTITIDQIRRVSYGKQGRDFVNKWVKIEYLERNTLLLAFFADGGLLGWSGVLGGTARMLKAVQRIPTIGE